jgi:predicted PurR-regulated permease PerM
LTSAYFGNAIALALKYSTPIIMDKPTPEQAALTAPSPATQAVAAEAARLPGPSPKPIADPFYARAFGITATIVLAYTLYRIVAPFLSPLLWALFIAFLLYPMHVRMTRRFKGRENLSAALLIVATFIVIVGPLAAMSAAFVSQASDLLHWGQETLGTQSSQQYRLLADMPVVGDAMDWLRETFGIRASQLKGWITQATQQLPTLLAGLGGQLFLGALNTVLSFVVMLFLLFFFVRDGASLVNLLRDMIPMATDRREQLKDHIAAVTRAVVFGMGATALVQGALVGVAFLITGLPSPVVFGVIAALLALLPAGGTALVWIPAVLVLLAQDRWGMAIVMLVIGIFSSSVDNVLRPLLISGRAEVSTLTVFIGVLGGTAAFGPIGLFLGPVVLALIIALMGFAQDQRRLAS